MATAPDPKHASALAIRAQKIAGRLAAAEAKGEARDRRCAEKEQRCLDKEKEKSRKTAKAEAEAQALKALKMAEAVERRNRKALEKAQEKQDRAESARRFAEREAQSKAEKRHQAHMGGVAWGYDARAGRRSSQAFEESRACCVAAGTDARVKEHSPDEVEELAPRAARKEDKGSTWGIEFGGPGREGKYEHASLRDGEKRSKKETARGVARSKDLGMNGKESARV